MSSSPDRTLQPTRSAVLRGVELATQRARAQARRGLPGRVWLGTVAVLGVGSALLSFWGFLRYNGTLGDVGAPARFGDALWRTGNLFLNNYEGPENLDDMHWSLRWGRIGVLVTLFALSAKALGAVLGDRLTALRLRLFAPDVIVLGLTADSLEIATAQSRRPWKPVPLSELGWSWRAVSQAFRWMLRPLRPSLRLQRVAAVTDDSKGVLATAFRERVGSLVVASDPASVEALERASLEKCLGTVYIAGNDDDLTAGLVRHALQYLAVSANRRPCLLPLIEDKNRLRAVLGEPGADEKVKDDGSEGAGEGKQEQQDASSSIVTLDPPMGLARLLLWRLPPDGGDPPGPGNRPIQVLILGATAIAERLILQLARAAYPRAGITRVVVVDPGVEAFRERLYRRFPGLDPACPDRVLFPGLLPLLHLDFRSEDPTTLPATLLAELQATAPFHAAYVVLDDDVRGVEAVARLQQLQARGDERWPVAICVRGEPVNCTSVTVVTAREVFEPLAGERYLGEWLEDAAALVHAVPSPGSADFDGWLQKLLSGSVQRSAARREAAAGWSAQREWRRESNRMVVDHIPVKLRFCGQGEVLGMVPLPVDTARRLRDVLESAEFADRLAELEHRRFCAERILAGWLPVPAEVWTRRAKEGAREVKADQHALREQRLNYSIRLEVSEEDRGKDKRSVLAMLSPLMNLEHGPPGLRTARSQSGKGE